MARRLGSLALGQGVRDDEKETSHLKQYPSKPSATPLRRSSRWILHHPIGPRVWACKPKRRYIRPEWFVALYGMVAAKVNNSQLYHARVYHTSAATTGNRSLFRRVIRHGYPLRLYVPKEATRASEEGSPQVDRACGSTQRFHLRRSLPRRHANMSC